MKNPIRSLKKYANEHQIELTILACAGTAIATTVLTAKYMSSVNASQADFISSKGLDGDYLVYLVENATK